MKGAGTAEGIEIFPKHDELKDGDFGNAIRGPLGIHRAISARFWFYGADYNLDNQLAFLKRVRSFREEHLSALLQKLGQRSEPEKKELDAGADAGSTRHSKGSFTSWTTSRCGGRSGGTGLRDVLRAPRRIETEAATTWRSRLTNRRSTSAGPVAPKK